MSSQDNAKISSFRKFLFRWLPLYLWLHRCSIFLFNDSAWYFWLLKNEKSRKSILEKVGRSLLLPCSSLFD